MKEQFVEEESEKKNHRYNEVIILMNPWSTLKSLGI